MKRKFKRDTDWRRVSNIFACVLMFYGVVFLGVMLWYLLTNDIVLMLDRF